MPTGAVGELLTKGPAVGELLPVVVTAGAVWGGVAAGWLLVRAGDNKQATNTKAVIGSTIKKAGLFFICVCSSPSGSYPGDPLDQFDNFNPAA